MKRQDKRTQGRSGKLQRAKSYKHPIPSRQEILECLEGAGRPLFRAELGRVLGLDREPQLNALEKRLKAMVRDGQLHRNRAREYCLTGHIDLVAGTVIAHRDGYGFLRPDGGGADIYLSAREMRALWGGDRVAVRASDSPRGREGQLVEILERGKAEIVGTLRRERGIDYVLEEGGTQAEILIARGELGGAVPGSIVRAAILEYPTERNLAIGRIVAVVGAAGEPGMETEVAILTHGIPAEWPDPVDEAARAIPLTVPSAAKHGREDLRELPLVTIDGANAKDFDDAVYCEPAGSGWRLVVAIADVSHYVKTDSAIDSEARLRGTSVYFPDRVVPMLPEALSNGLCSLNPKVDRLCLVCDMHVSERGLVTRSRFYEAVMRSSARLTYEQAWDLLSKPAKQKNRGNPVLRTLRPLHDVYRVLAKARARRGAIDFRLPEMRIELGGHGQIASIGPAVRLETHKLIEECMVAANVEAAKRIRKARIPSLYRVHEGPDAERIDELYLFLRTFGVRLPSPEKLKPRDLSRIIAELGERPDAELIETMILRSMNQAVYQPKNVGHFGLALDAYAHFTSPIRRYPDLLVHRAIKWLVNEGSFKGFGYTMADMTQLGEQCSRTERRADEAVWDVEEQLKCIYMRDRVGQSFDGIVASVVPFGLFVRLPELAVDGLVHVSSLPRDYYHREPSGAALVGERTGQRYGLTDRIRVRVTNVNVEERKIDFVPEGVADEEAPPRRGRPKTQGAARRQRRGRRG